MGDVGEAITSEVGIGVRAESSIDKIVSKVHPTPLSEQRRRAVICYIQRLIKHFLGCEVFPYGSVPLKTYLPDGDIDLTAFVAPSLEEALANDVMSVLQAEEQNDAAEFIVKDIQLIRAEVKIVKCMVQNIVVDISFNQLGGLCTLCFLERVDRLIGKDHLFKRSIILIKAWCYYESRILGAHHALISTYALETLVLYIFHLFHSELNGPLAVLYRFLDHFSKFDWDNYCISLNGPVRISSSPEIGEMKIGNGERNLLLNDEFLRDCENMFSVPPREFDKHFATFTPKHLNIIDPLKGSNNLGRSVSKGNLFRIRSAFAYGARKLGRALSQEDDNIAEELSKFFSNTLDRHGNGHRPDVQDLVGGYFPRASSFSETESYKETYAANSVPINGVCKCDYGDDDGASFVTQQNVGDYPSGEIAGNKHERGCSRGTDGRFMPGSPADIGYCLSRDAEDQTSFKLQSLKITNDTPKALKSTPPIAPHLYFCRSKANANSSEKSSSCGPEENVPSVTNQHVPTAVGTKDMAEQSLSDLNGDYESHCISLQYGRFCYEHSSAVPAALPPPLPSPWDMVRQAYPYKRNGFPNGHSNSVGMIPRPGFYPSKGMMLITPSGTTSFGQEDFPKQRGTGTYIPNANRPPYRNHLMGRGRNNEQGPLHRNQHSPRHSSWTPFKKIDSSFIVNGLDVVHQLHREEDGLTDVPHVSGRNSSVTRQQNLPFADGLGVNNVPHGPGTSSSTTRQQKLPSPRNHSPPSPPPCAPEDLQSTTPVLPASNNDSRLLMANLLYRLKDEDDFPPLSI